MNVLGIDPGLKGGIAYISNHHVEAVPMPLMGGSIDPRAIVQILKTQSVELVVIEKVGPRPKQGVVSVWTFGYGVGVIAGAVEAIGVPMRWVTPQAWKKVVLAGTPKDKDAAIQFVRAAYPGIPLIPERARVPHDGMADALCIAEYGRRTFGAG